MTAILPLEVCVNDLPSRLSYTADQAHLDLSVCLKVPIQDLVACLVGFQKRQEASIAETTKSPSKPELKAQTPPGLLPPTGVTRPHELAAVAAVPSENMTGPPAIAAAHGPQVSSAIAAAAAGAAAAPAAVQHEATHAAQPMAGAAAAPANTVVANPVPVGLQETPGTWNSSISKLQPWYEDYSKKARWTEQPSPFEFKQGKERGLQLLRNLMLDDFAKPGLDLKEINAPSAEYDPMPNPLPLARPSAPPSAPAPRSEPPSAPPPARPDPTAAQLAAAGLRGLVGSSPAEPAQEPGAEPESEEAASNQNAALPMPQEAPPPPPPPWGNGTPPDGPPPGFIAAAPPGLPAPPPGSQPPPAGRGSPQQGALNNGNPPRNEKECKSQ